MTEKLKHRIECDFDGPLKVVRIHRQFFGRLAVKEPILVEVEYEEHETLFACIGVDDAEGTLGRAARVEKVPGLVVTPDPSLYGTDADRLANGKAPFVECKFGEWVPVNLHEL